MKLAKVSHLEGLRFGVSSGNHARVRVLGPGGLSIIFKHKPTEQDIKEADAYVASKMEPDLNVVSSNHGKIDAQCVKEIFEDYRKFLLGENDVNDSH